MKTTLYSITTILLLFISCSAKHFDLPVYELELQTSSGDSVVVHSEIAKTEEERNYGFMNRKDIPDGTGMLFIFETDRKLSFWMKDTPHPLSIAYIDSSGIIQDIFDMTPYSLAPIQSSRSVRFALEVPQGYFEKVGISEGDTVNIKDFL